jgi:hypothetical protein
MGPAKCGPNVIVILAQARTMGPAKYDPNVVVILAQARTMGPAKYDPNVVVILAQARTMGPKSKFILTILFYFSITFVDSVFSHQSICSLA